jgi:glycosyltransferase involved in cell wall biosynthesis
MKKILFITNILTPYRVFLFDNLYMKLKSQNIELRVISIAKTEANRVWEYDQLKREYTRLLKSYTLSRGKLNIHLTSNLLISLFKFSPDFTILSGGYLIPGVLLSSIILSKYKMAFWSESNLLEIRSLNKYALLIRELLRYVFYNRFMYFLSPGILADNLINRYNKKSRIIRFRNVINESIFINEELQIERNNNLQNYKNRKVFFTVARLTKSKGIVEFINILKNTRNVNSILYIIAGEGELRETINELSIESNLKIELLGNISEDLVVNYLRACDVFVLPSLSDPYPLSVIEALWSGKPLLLSDRVGNYLDAVINDENGFIFNVLDEKSSLVIDELLSKPTSWFDNAAMVSNSIARSKFSVNNITDNLIKEIKNIYENHSIIS